MRTRSIGAYVSTTEVIKKGAKASSSGYPRRHVGDGRVGGIGRAHALEASVLPVATHLLRGNGIGVYLQRLVQRLAN